MGEGLQQVSEAGPRIAKVIPRIAGLDGAAWDGCANPDPARYDPFVSHAFLQALEDSGTTGRKTGWNPQHLVLEDESGGVAACMPLYLKTHSQGEFVFDHKASAD